MKKRSEGSIKLLLVLVPVLLIPPALLLRSLPENEVVSGPDAFKEGPRHMGGGRYHMGMKSVHFPWKGNVQAGSFDVGKGGTFAVGFDILADMTRIATFEEDVEAMYAVLVGEPVYRADGQRTGFSGITLTTRFTQVGMPLEHYIGTLPVGEFGDKRGSPFESVVSFDADALKLAETPEAVRLTGEWQVSIDETVPEGWYRPHVELFVKFRGSEKEIDLRHLGITLGSWVNDRADTLRPKIPHQSTFNPADLHEFMKDAQVLPNVRVGNPAQPRLIFTLFSDVAAHGQAALMANEDKGHAGLSNRSRFPTPFVLQPGTWNTVPGMPAEFPSSGLAGLFQGFGSLTREVESWMDLSSGTFTMRVTDPDGRVADLGTRTVAHTHEGGLALSGGAFAVDLRRTGDYVIELQGCFKDTMGRELCGGGTYELTCALPMSFSTAVKPGTNFLVGARYPAVMDINPAVEADVFIDITYLPNSDPERKIEYQITGRSTRFGYFEPEEFPPPFDEPGEYYSLLSVRWRDQSGNLWLGQQSSAGVIAPVDSPVRLHGTRTSFFDPRAEMPQLGAFDRYLQRFEGGSSFAEHSALSFYDHTFPYYSGDVLYVPTTYPLESVIGPSLAMSADTPELKARFEELYLPDGPLPGYPYANRFRRLWYLPDVYKLSEDNFTYHTIEPGVMDNLPILPVSTTGYSPYAWPEDLRLDAYTYLSVIRPGLPVMSMAYAGNFMAPCWIISPNDYGYRFHSSPNGDLPEDLYRVMGGLVVRDLETGENYYDAYSSAIRILPPGSEFTAVQPPGEVPIVRLSGRDEYVFLGLNTSGVFSVGHRMLLGGTLMPPSPATVHFDVTYPSGRQIKRTVVANRLGGVSPPPGLFLDEPGVYRVIIDIELEKQDGSVVHGDVVGSGDGEILYFAVPTDQPRVVASPLPAMSRVDDLDRISVPIAWDPAVKNPKLTWSVMTPGSLFDEGTMDLEPTGTYDFVMRPRQMQVQLSNYDTVDASNGQQLLTDIVVFVFFFEGELDGRKVYDSTRVAMRGDVLLNPDALVDPAELAGVGPYVGDAPRPQATYPAPGYTKDVDLDGLHVTYGQGGGGDRPGGGGERREPPPRDPR